MSLCVVLLQFLPITKYKNHHFCIKLIKKRMDINMVIKNTASLFPLQHHFECIRTFRRRFIVRLSLF